MPAKKTGKKKKEAPPPPVVDVPEEPQVFYGPPLPTPEEVAGARQARRYGDLLARSEDLSFLLEGCPEHQEQLISYCVTCSTALCNICSGLSHTAQDGHDVRPLNDFVQSRLDNVKEVARHNANISAQLDALEQQLPRDERQLHLYIDDEARGLLDAVAAKRRELHEDVDTRHRETLALLTDELYKCETALHSLHQGREVLNCLMTRSGTVPGPIGDIILGKASYEEFLALADPPLPDPPRIRETLRLQLPMQSLQEVCDMLHWGQLSLENCPQAFPL